MKRLYGITAIAAVLLALGCDNVSNDIGNKNAIVDYSGTWTVTYTTISLPKQSLTFDMVMKHKGSSLSGRGTLQDGRAMTFDGTLSTKIDFSGVVITASISFSPSQYIPRYTYDVRGKFTSDRFSSGTVTGRTAAANNFTFTMIKK